MKKITSIILAIFLSANTFAQNSDLKIYPFKSAIIKYKLSGDYSGTRTLYIDDYGNKTKSITEGEYILHQKGENPRIKFSAMEITNSGLKYSFNNNDYTCTVSANDFNAYYKANKNINKTLEHILTKMKYEKTGKTEKINNYLCDEYKQVIKFIVSFENTQYFNKDNVLCKRATMQLPETEVLGSEYIETIESIDTKAQINPEIFNDFPDSYFYQFANNSDSDGNYTYKLVFPEGDANLLENKLKQMSFKITKYINQDEFVEKMKSYGQSLSNECSLQNMNSDEQFSYTISFPDSIDYEKETSISLELSRLQSDNSFIKEYSGTSDFDSKKLISSEKFTKDNNGIVYLKYIDTSFGEETYSVLSFQNKNYRTTIEVSGEKTKEEMLKILKDLKIWKQLK